MYGVLLALGSQALFAQVQRRLEPKARPAVVPDHYIVELQGDPVLTRLIAQRTASKGVLKLDLHSAAARRRRTEIQAEQAALRPKIEALGGEVLDTIDNVANDLLVSIPDAKAAELAKLPGVKRVLRDRLMYPTLDRAVQIHKAPQVWAAVGEDKAGLGTRIAIIDSGVDNSNPALQDDSLPTIPGFPQVSTNANRPYTNKKVIVARSYPKLWPVTSDPDTSARDRVGHGTAAAVVAAGVRTATPYATIEGMAPKAYIGSYKIYGTPGLNDGASTISILKAISDAIGDGMDVINFSSGQALALSDGYEGDQYADIIQQLTDAGILFVASAGNDGPDLNTIGSPANVSQAIAVGAISNDRIFGSIATLSGGATFIASPLTGEENLKPVTGKIVDAQAIDKTNEACSIPAGTNLRGAVVVISYPVTACTFSTEYRALATAGVAAVILAFPASEGPNNGFGYFIGPANPPISFVDFASAQALRAAIAADPTQTVTLPFAISPQPVSYHQLAGFSSVGPTDTGGIKPDLLAVGTSIVTGAQKFDQNGDLYDPTGFTITNGTSFSAPMVSGAAALLKSARPGLLGSQYRSLLINSASQFLPDGSTIAAPVQQTGAGLLDVFAAYKNTVTMEPTSLAFGVQGYTLNLAQSLRLTNIGGTRETYTLSSVPRTGSGRAPQVFTTSVTLDPGQQRDVTISLDNSALTSGTQDGFIVIRSSVSGIESHVPYFYAVPGKATRVLLLAKDPSYLVGVVDQFAFLFRIYDANGVALTKDVVPTVTVVSGGGSVTKVALTDVYGTANTWGANVKLGSIGANVFRITAGDAKLDVTINGISGN